MGQIQHEGSEVNNRVLHGIFNSISPNEFYRIVTYKYVKRTYDFLFITHEDTSTMNLSKF